MIEPTRAPPRRSVLPTRSEARSLKRQFGRYVDALVAGKFSEAIAPWKGLGGGGIEVLFRPGRRLASGVNPRPNGRGSRAGKPASPLCIFPAEGELPGDDRHLASGVCADVLL
jgi:hypothetical protein